MVPCIYDTVSRLGDDHVQVKREGLWGLYNKQYEMSIPCIYDEIHPFHEGYARVKKNGIWTFVNKNGEELF